MSRNALTGGQVKDHVNQILAEHLISDTIPVRSVLTALKQRQHVFVLVVAEVKGLVTKADLSKPPLRIYLFGIISLLEMHLSFCVRREYDEASLRRDVPPSRLAGAQRIEAERKVRGEEMELFDCLQLCDKRDLVLKRRDVSWSLGLDQKAVALKRLKRVESIRNLLAHN